MDNFKNYQIIAVILLITSQVFTFVTPPPPHGITFIFKELTC